MLTLLSMNKWFYRYCTNPHASTLLGILAVFYLCCFCLGSALFPFWVTLVLAYLLEKPSSKLEQMGVPRPLVAFLMTAAIVTAFLLLGLLIPRGVHQLQTFLSDMSNYSEQLRAIPDKKTSQLIRLPLGLIDNFFDADWGQTFFKLLLGAAKRLLNTIYSLLNSALNICLVPFLLFFSLKDKEKIEQFCLRLLPEDHKPLLSLYRILKEKLERYVKNRLIELLIMWLVSTILFEVQGLRYAFLLGLAVGLGTVIPYFGFAFATLLVAIATALQLGNLAISIGFFMAYLGLQALDKTLIYTLLSSEAAQLHPLTIMFAILVCGEWFGFWGLVFAVPLASGLKILWTHWPTLADDPVYPALGEETQAPANL